MAASDALLVVIGRNWQIASSHSSQSRLFDTADWLRAEIEAAFAQGKQVIPVLVAGAKMSVASDLPESIAQLSSIQAFVMTDRRWDDDIKRLVQLLLNKVPTLKPGSIQQQQASAESPAQVLRELGDSVLAEVVRERNKSGRSGYIKPQQRSRLATGVYRLAKKILTIGILLAAIYIGIRLFGDTETLQKLDQLETRLQTGWSRLLNYLSRIK